MEFDEYLELMEGKKQVSPEKNMTMASAPDPMDERNSMMENIAMQEFGKPLSDLTEDEIKILRKGAGEVY